MKRRLTQEHVDGIRAEYERWDKFGAESETSEELARRLGISKATLYRLRERGWSIGSRATATVQDPGAGDDLNATVQWLVGELAAARVRISQLERELAERNGDPA